MFEGITKPFIPFSATARVCNEFDYSDHRGQNLRLLGALALDFFQLASLGLMFMGPESGLTCTPSAYLVLGIIKSLV